MKTLFTFLFLAVFALGQAQKHARKYDAFYLSATLDPNQLTNVIDNPRMENDVKGLNYRIEAGAMGPLFEGYFFFEDFPVQKYYTAGFGFNALITPTDRTFISAGLNYGFTVRDYWKHNGAATGGGVQIKLGYHLNKEFALIAEGEAKQRPDLENLAGVLQFKVGLRYLFNKNGSREGRRFK
jgi:hypothetical protein